MPILVCYDIFSRHAVYTEESAFLQASSKYFKMIQEMVCRYMMAEA